MTIVQKTVLLLVGCFAVIFGLLSITASTFVLTLENNPGGTLKGMLMGGFGVTSCCIGILMVLYIIIPQKRARQAK